MNVDSVRVTVKMYDQGGRLSLSPQVSVDLSCPHCGAVFTLTGNPSDPLRESEDIQQQLDSVEAHAPFASPWVHAANELSGVKSASKQHVCMECGLISIITPKGREKLIDEIKKHVTPEWAAEQFEAYRSQKKAEPAANTS